MLAGAVCLGDSHSKLEVTCFGMTSYDLEKSAVETDKVVLPDQGDVSLCSGY